MCKINVDDSVLAELQKGNFDIGGDTYSGVMKSISGYIKSIYDAIQSLEESWNATVSNVGTYIQVADSVPDPEYDPTPDALFLEGDLANASLKGVSSYLNVRSDAGTANGVVGTIANGVAFTLLNDYKNDGDGNAWYHVKYKNEDGKEVDGWVSSKYVSIDGESLDSAGSTDDSGGGSASHSENGTPSSTPSRDDKESSTEQTASKKKNTTKKAIVDIKSSDSALNIRKEPGGEIVGSLTRGQVVEIINDDNKSPYIKIKMDNGEIGYVARKYINIPSTESQIVKVKLQDPNSHLNVRSSGSMVDNTNIVDSLSNGASVEVISTKNGWAEIKLNGATRYVSTDYLDM